MELKEIPFEREGSETSGTVRENSIDNLPLDLPAGYRAFLETCNGGYTADDFFHFFGLVGPIQHNVIEWNRKELWKDFYHFDDAFFVFVEDVLGGQYYFKRGGRKNAVYLLDPNNGKTYFMADNYENFLRDVVANSDEICREVKALAEAYFGVPGNERKYLHHLSYMHPIIPGGSEGDISNFDQCDSLVNLSILGQLVRGLENVEPGTPIKDVDIDYEKGEVRLIF
ncbi:MAG: SMI1/KNR4 family protein [Planctomycetota bacterium]|jgi:hypothetical protein